MGSQKKTKTVIKRQTDIERDLNHRSQKNVTQHSMTNDTTTTQPDKKLFLDSI